MASIAVHGVSRASAGHVTRTRTVPAVGLSVEVDRRAERLATGLVAFLVAASVVAIAVLGLTLLEARAAAVSLPGQVGGHVLVEPGERLTDVAVRTLPSGVDAQRHYDAIVALNPRNFDGSTHHTIALVPAY